MGSAQPDETPAAAAAAKETHQASAGNPGLKESAARLQPHADLKCCRVGRVTPRSCFSSSARTKASRGVFSLLEVRSAASRSGTLIQHEQLSLPAVRSLTGYQSEMKSGGWCRNSIGFGAFQDGCVRKREWTVPSLSPVGCGTDLRLRERNKEQT